MSKNKIEPSEVIKAMTDKQIKAVIAEMFGTKTGEQMLVAAMDKMFTEGKWEIPDDAIVGIYAAKVDQLEAQNTSLLALVKQLAAEVRGEPIRAGQRVDAIAAAKITNKNTSKK